MGQLSQIWPTTAHCWYSDLWVIASWIRVNCCSWPNEVWCDPLHTWRDGWLQTSDWKLLEISFYCGVALCLMKSFFVEFFHTIEAEHLLLKFSFLETFHKSAQFSLCLLCFHGVPTKLRSAFFNKCLPLYCLAGLRLLNLVRLALWGCILFSSFTNHVYCTLLFYLSNCSPVILGMGKTLSCGSTALLPYLCMISWKSHYLFTKHSKALL